MYGIVFFHPEDAISVNRKVKLIVVGYAGFDIKI